VATRVWTVGHSTRTIIELLEILRGVPIERVVDVRTLPKSRYNPQFDRDAFSWELEQASIDYRHAPELGGLRKPLADSINRALHEEGLRGYADHMQTSKFRDGVERLIEEAERSATTVICAEASPWQCHRRLLADGLSARGVEVTHLLASDRAEPHHFSPLARVRDAGVTYPGLL
jgi:uncharacterized protein (DUF488 family)